jgi:hypothetical protein
MTNVLPGRCPECNGATEHRSTCPERIYVDVFRMAHLSQRSQTDAEER